MVSTQVSYIRTDGTPAHLDDYEIDRLQTSAPTDVPYLTEDLSQMYEDIILGIEPMRPITSTALEYLNRWIMGKLSTEETISNLDALGYLDWVIPEGYINTVNRLELENDHTD